MPSPQPEQVALKYEVSQWKIPLSIYQPHPLAKPIGCEPFTTRWFACVHTVEGEVLYLCPDTSDPDLVNGLFYWHPDSGRRSLFDTQDQAVFSLWRTLIREQFKRPITEDHDAA